jgi:hypothetical protein
MEAGFPLSEIDTTRPHPARMYDAYLGGKDNYAADREAVRQILRNWPEVRAMARANRAAMQRMVRFLAGEAGIQQFLDIGTGIPSSGNVHEVAGQVAPDSSVVYVDNVGEDAAHPPGCVIPSLARGSRPVVAAANGHQDGGLAD